MKNNEILWEQTLDASEGWLSMGFWTTIIGVTIGMAVYNVFQIYELGFYLDQVSLIESVLYLGGGVLYLFFKSNHLFVASTLQYQIKKDAVIYRWGIKKSKEVEIPFDDITAINLVEYDNSDHSTIYINTKGDYKITKANFDDNSPRHTYTLEMVENGPEVYRLMQEQWRMA